MIKTELITTQKNRPLVSKPDWIKVRNRYSKEYIFTREILAKFNLNTICEQALCPNRCECFGRKTATFLILGRYCTRNCSFCNVEKHEPDIIDESEPDRISKAAEELGLKHVVITSVSRDDLNDGGASHFAGTISKLRALNPGTTVEVLVPDFAGNEDSLMKVIEAKPDILSHNIETVSSIYPKIRPMADYERSLGILDFVNRFSDEILTKSGIMLGLGETEREVLNVISDIRSTGCGILTIGQYLSPSEKHYPVVEYVHPSNFERYKEYANNIGFKFVLSSPLARSSYLAENAFNEIN